MVAIAATTDRGTGLVLPLAKGISRLIFVYNALAREWPINREETAVEINEAIQHFSAMTLNEQMLSDAAFAALTDWRASVEDIRVSTDAAARAEPEEPNTEEIKQAIRNATIEAWQILTLVDRELTGLTDAQTDPGRLP